MPKTLLAWNNGDRFTVDGIAYYVLNVKEQTVAAYSTTKTGALTIPATVFDGKDQTFTVVQIGGLSTNSAGFVGVTSFTLPNSIKFIALQAFNGSQITTLHLPASVTNIVSTFGYHLPTTLASITVDAANPNFEAANGVLYTKGKKALICYPAAKSGDTFSVSNGVEEVWVNAFMHNSYLKTINIPASVKTIQEGSYSISSAANLTTVNVHTSNANYVSIDGVVFSKDKTRLIYYPMAKNAGGSYTVPTTCTEIVQLAFYRAKIKSIDLANVETIGKLAFYTSALTSVTLGAKTKSLNNPFESAPLASVGVASGNPYFTVVGGVLFSKDQKTLVLYPSHKAGTEYAIPNGTEVIGNSAFTGNRYIETLNVAASVSKVEQWSFRRMASLKNLNFPVNSKITVLTDNFLWESPRIEGLALPASLTSLGYISHSNLPNLRKITVADGSQLKTIGRLFGDQSAVFSLEEFTFLGSSVLETIGTSAFRNTKLKSFTIPATVTTIGESAFNGCKNLTNVTFPADNVSKLETIGPGAFANTAFKLTRIPPSVKTIGREAFWNVKTASSIAISAQTDSISPEAFKGCYALKFLNVDRTNMKYSSIDGQLLTKDKETLVLFPPGKANSQFTLLAPSIRTIGDYAFYANDNLTNVTIPNKVTRIGKRSFGLCPNLNTVTFLCDEMIDPANIRQLLNESTFDDGLTTATDRRKNIAIHVRRNQLGNYQTNDFYKKFKSINPSFVSGDAEYIAVSDNAVDLLSTTSTDYTYTLPKSVTSGSKAYNVKLIGDYAFQNAAADIKEVVVPGDMEYIGAKAFMTDIDGNGSTVESIFLINGNVNAETFSTTRFELDDTGNDYSEFAASTKVYVKKRVFNSAAFGNAVARYTSDATTHLGTPVRPATPNMFDYKIPGINLTKTYGTFAREFDVDLADYFAEYGAGKVYAFTSAPDQTIYEGRGDGSEPGTWYIKMYSINEDQNGDGTYIPAYTGVMLKSMGGAATPTEAAANGAFYYTIGDSTTVNTNVSSVLVGVTVRNREVKDTNKDIYVMSGGLFKPLNGQTVASFPVHKAYLQLPSSQYPGSNTSGAKLVFLFDDVLTEIDAFGIDGGLKTKDDGGPVYDLQGRRVNAPQKGIYIKNGKKMVVK